jgi:hypothetical protein
MNRLASAAAIALLSASTLGFAQLPSLAQLPSPNPGAPFTAVETRTITSAGKVTVRTAIIARKSDGSTYRRSEPGSLNGAVDPKHSQPTALAYDSTRHLVFSIDIPHASYVAVQKTLSPQLRTPALAAPGPFMQPTAASGSGFPSASTHTVNLGIHTIDGLDAVGSLVDYASGGSFEEWVSPKLFLVLKSTSHAVSPPEDSVTTISQLQLGEPDPALFEIPAGFTPAPAPRH